MTLHVGVLGLGVGKHHVDALLSHEDVSEIYVFDPDHSLVKKLVSQHPNIIPCATEDQILLNDAIDMVSICSYDDKHFDQTVAAIESKKHVFVEKPICLSEPELAHLNSLLSQNPEITLGSNLVLRTIPRFVEIREQVMSNALGPLYYLEADYLWGRREKFLGWRGEIDFYSVILGAGVHMIDLVVWIAGELPVHVKATGNNIATAGSRFRFNSFAVMLLTFPSGLVAKISANGACVHPHFHGLKVFGCNRSLVSEWGVTRMIEKKDDDYTSHDFAGDYPGKEYRRNLLLDFINSVVDSRKPTLIQTEEIFNTMSICFAAEQAMHSDHAVEIDYLPSCEYPKGKSNE